LFFIRKWYLFYQNDENVSQLVRQIPWGHNREIIVKCADIEEAVFYVERTIENNWSRAILLMQIEGNLYKRQGKAIHNFQETCLQLKRSKENLLSHQINKLCRLAKLRIRLYVASFG
jgi:predicted nuclease of restriction endonuclease-like (RecB) superfamily